MGRKKRKKDFRRNLLLQIEKLRIRAGFSYEDLSQRLGLATENTLAAYIAGKRHIREPELEAIAGALKVRKEELAQRWLAGMGIEIVKGAVEDCLQEALRDHLQRRRTWGLHPSPSPVTVIRTKYADRLPRQPLFLTHRRDRFRRRDEKTWIRDYELLVEAVHGGKTYVEIGRAHGFSAQRASQLIWRVAYAWARAEGIDMISESKAMPWKNAAQDIEKLYAALKSISRQALKDARNDD